MSIATTRPGYLTRARTSAVLLGAAALVLTAARWPDGTTPPASTPVARGLTFTYTVTSTSTDKRRKEATDIQAMVRLQGGKARMDYTNGKGPMGQKEGYIVVSPTQFMIVNPKDKQVMIMEPGQFGAGMGALLNNPMMKMTINNARFSFKDLGAGENLLGYRTRHVRLFNSSDIEVKIMGMTQRSSSSDSSDQWIAQGVEVDDDALAAWGKSFTSGMKATNPEMAAEFAKYQQEYGRQGMALRSTTWSTTTDGKGKVTSDVITMEVTDLKKGDVDPAIFDIPANYEVINLSETMAAAKASMDSAKKANGDSTAKKEAKPSAGDAIKSGLGGMFKKKPPV